MMLRLEDVIKRLETAERELRDVKARAGLTPLIPQRGIQPTKFQPPVAPRTPPSGIADAEIWYDDEVDAYRGQASGTQMFFMTNLRSDGLPIFAGTFMGIELVGGAGVTLTPSGSAIQLEASGAGGMFTNLPYVMMSNTSSLSAERALTAGSLMALDDGGANAAVTLNTFTDYLVQGSRISGSAMSLDIRGVLKASVAGSLSGRQVVVSVYVPSMGGGNGAADGAPGAAPNNAEYVVLSASATLSQERALTAGSLIQVNDAGAGNAVTLNAFADYLAQGSRISGTAMSLDVRGTGYASLTGSLSGRQAVVTIHTASEAHPPLQALSGSLLLAQHAFTHPHAGLSGIGIDDHHARDHASTHHSGGADALALQSVAGSLLLAQHAFTHAHAGLSGIDVDDHHARDHASTHHSGGADEIALQSVAGSLLLAQHAFTHAHANLSGIGASDHHAPFDPTGLAPNADGYIVASQSGSLSQARTITAGSLIALDDAGAGSTVTLNSFNDYLVQGSRISGSAMALDARGTGYASLQGSLSGRHVVLTTFVPSMAGGGGGGDSTPHKLVLMLPAAGFMPGVATDDISWHIPCPAASKFSAYKARGKVASSTAMTFQVEDYNSSGTSQWTENIAISVSGSYVSGNLSATRSMADGNYLKLDITTANNYDARDWVIEVVGTYD